MDSLTLNCHNSFQNKNNIKGIQKLKNIHLKKLGVNVKKIK